MGQRFGVAVSIFLNCFKGGTPSPFDRNLGTNMAARATSWMLEKAESHLNADGQVIVNDPSSAVLLGLRKMANPFTPVVDLKDEADFVYRRSKKQWWMQMRSVSQFADFERTFSIFASLSLSHKHTHTHVRTHARTYTKTECVKDLE